MGKSLARLKSELLAKPAVKAEYDALEEEFAVIRAMVAARARAGLTQAELAARMGTTQSAVARLESGRVHPSLETLRRYAKATSSRLVVRLEDAAA